MMRIRLRFIVVMFILFMCLTHLVVANEIVDANQLGSIELQLFDEEGAPIEGWFSSWNARLFKLSKDNMNKQVSNFKYDRKKKVFLLKGKKPDQYQIKLNFRNKWLAEDKYEVEVKPGQLTKKKIVLKEAPFIKIYFDEEIMEVDETIHVTTFDKNKRKIKTSSLRQDYQTNVYKFYLMSNKTSSFTVRRKGFLETNKIPLRKDHEINKFYYVELKSSIVLSGVITDKHSIGIEGAKVNITYLDKNPAGIWFKHNNYVKSNKLGVFKFDTLKRGDFLLSFSARRYADKEHKVSLERSVHDLKIQMDEGSIISGTVITKNNDPAMLVEVKLTKVGASKYKNLIKKTKANKQGEFTIAHVPDGVYQLSVDSDDYGYGKSKELAVNKTDLDVKLKVYMPNDIVDKFQGIVLGENGKPIEGAIVKIFWHRGELRDLHEVKSDMNGVFFFKDLRMGRYAIYIQKLGYLYLIDWFNLGLNVSEEIKTYKLINDKVLNGHVLTPDAKKVDHVELKLISDSSSSSRAIVYSNLNEKGEFKIKLSELHRRARSFNSYRSNQYSYKLNAKVKGYNPGESDAFKLIELGAEPIVIKLKPEKEIKLKVIDVTGKPIENALVQIRWVNENSYLLKHKIQNRFEHDDEEQTDKNGKVSFTGINKGYYLFNVIKPSFAKTVLPLFIDPDKKEVYVLGLENGATLSGQIKDIRGRPKANATIVLDPLYQDGGILDDFRIKSDENGRYHFDLIPSGVYRVYEERLGKSGSPLHHLEPPEQVEIEIKENESHFLNIQKVDNGDRGKITGFISKGSSYSKATLKKENESEAKTLDIKGDTFAFENLESANYTVTLRKEDYSTTKKVYLMRNEHLDLKYDYSEMILNAKVVSKSGKLLPRMLVSLFNKKLNRRSRAFMVNGNLSMKVYEPGDYKLFIGLNYFQYNEECAVIDLHFKKGEEKDLGEIIIDSGLTFKGKVVDENGEFVPKLRFELVYENYNFKKKDINYLNDGSFEFAGVPSMPDAIIVHAENYISKRIKPGSNILDVQLEKALDLKVKLSGKSVAQRKVVLCNEFGRPVSDQDKFTEYPSKLRRTDTQGNIVLKDLPSRKYRIRVLPRNEKGFSVLSDVIEVKHGEEKFVLNLVLK